MKCGVLFQNLIDCEKMIKLSFHISLKGYYLYL